MQGIMNNGIIFPALVGVTEKAQATEAADPRVMPANASHVQIHLNLLDQPARA